MTDKRFFMLTGTVVAIAIAVSLYFINNIYQNTHQETREKETDIDLTDAYANTYRQSIEFNGLPVNKDLTLAEYNRKGKLLRQNLKLSEIIGDKGCIALLSTNNCTGCVKNEIALLRKIDNHGRILFIYDSPVHTITEATIFRRRYITNLRAENYYPDLRKIRSCRSYYMSRMAK